MELNGTGVAIDHDPVNAPRHYRSHPSGIECIEVTRQLSFDAGNAVKYVWRRGDKGTAVQDVEKSLFYIRDARSHAPSALYVPPAAARLLHLAANADHDSTAARFYRAVAVMDWAEAELAAQLLLSQLQHETF